MKADKKDKFKDLLKLSGNDKPAADFTSSILKTIEADLQREAALKAILQKEEGVGPSFSFTANVMAGIQASKPQFVYKPIIAKKVWYGIAAVFILFVMIIILPGGAPNTSTRPGSIATLMRYAYAIPPIYVLALAGIVTLLAVDYALNRTKNKTAGTVA